MLRGARSAVKLDLFDGLAHQLGLNVGQLLAEVAMILFENPAAVAHHEAGFAAGHVNLLASRQAFTIDRPHYPGAGLLGAVDQCLQPAGRNDDIVIDEHDVRSACVLCGQVPRLIRTQVVLAPDHAESVRQRLLGDMIAHFRRRIPVDVHQFIVASRRGQNVVERRPGVAESFARNDGNGDQCGIHDGISLCPSKQAGHCGVGGNAT